MTKPKFEHIRLSSVGDVVLIELMTREIRVPEIAQELGTELQHVLAQDWAKRLLLDFHKVAYFSSTAFAVTFRAVVEGKKKGIEIKLCGMDGGIELGAGIIGLDKVAEIHSTQTQALEAFKKV
jgi:anti-anti-sigma factor